MIQDIIEHCEYCETEENIVYDDMGRAVCTDCLFENMTEEELDGVVGDDDDLEE